MGMSYLCTMTTASDPQPAPSAPLGLRQLALTFTDVPRAVTFYREVLGIPLAFETDGLAFFELDGVRLMFTQPSAPEFAHANSVIYLAVTDAEQAFASAVARGARPERPAQRVGQTATHDIVIGFVRDPEGNLIGLAEDRVRR